MNEKITEIYRALLDMIGAGKLRPGMSLPREIDLAKEFNTNRMNAHRAVKQLEKHGLVLRKKRSGTFLRKELDTQEINKLVKEANRIVYVLYSMKPYWIHWNETSFTALEEQVTPHNYSVMYRNIPSKSTREDYMRLLKDISEKGASALVIFPDTDDTDFLKENSDLLLDFQVPVLMLNRSGGPLPFDMVSFVSMDPFGDGVTVGSLLRKNGCSKVVMLNEETGSAFWGIKRYEGLELGLRRGGGAFRADLENVLVTPERIAETVERIRASEGDIVIVAVNNEYAARFMDFARKRGVDVPGNCRVISFDDNPLYRSYNLTSIAAPVRGIGELFGTMICEDSGMNAYKGKIAIKLPGKLIIRETFKPAV